MKKVLLVLILSFIATLNYAQNSSSKLSSDSLIRFSRNRFWGTEKFFINGKQITQNELYAKLMNYPPSANEFKIYKKYRDLTNYAVGAALAFLAASAIATGNSSTFKNTSSKVFFGAGCGFIIPEAIFAGKRTRHFRRSFGLYNQQFQ